MADSQDNILLNVQAEDNASDIFEEVEKATEGFEQAFEDATDTLKDFEDGLKDFEKPLEEAGDGMERAVEWTKDWEEQLASAISVQDAASKTIALLTKDIEGGVRAFEESSQKIVDAHKKLSEYGANVDQQRRALDLMNKAITEQGVNAATAGLVMEELAIEYTDAEVALSHYNKALQFATNSLLRKEEAVADYVDATKGGTAGLRRFGAAATAQADAIDKIQDPTLRATKSIQAMERAQRKAAKGGDLLTKATDKLAIAELELAAAGPLVANGVLAIAGAWIAAGAAASAYAIKGAKLALDANWQTIQATKDFEDALDKLHLSFGNALIGPPEEAAASLSNLTRVLQELEKSVSDNAEEINDFVGRAVDKLEILLDTLATVASIGLLPWALMNDAISGFMSLIQVLVGVIIEDLGGALTTLGLISEDTGKALTKFGTDTVKAGEDTNYLTDDLYHAWDAFTDFTSAVNSGGRSARRGIGPGGGLRQRSHSA